MSSEIRNVNLRAVIFLASLVVAAIYVALQLTAAGWRPVAALDDAYIHFQYARQMALGQPFRYNPGDPFSTGATSLLYPVLLAGAYRLGWQDEALVWPALAAGALALVLSTLLIYRITVKLAHPLQKAPSFGRLAGLFSAGLFLFSGAIPWAYANGMETGLFALVVLAALLSFVEGRAATTAVFLALAGLLRPEGLFLAGVAWLVVAWQFTRDPSGRRRAIAFLTLAVTAAGLPYLINLALTGTPVATGAQAKSWLGNVPFLLDEALRNMGRMAGFILERLALGFLASKPWPVPPGVLPLALWGGWLLWRGGSRSVLWLIIGWVTIGTLLSATLITALWHVGRYQVPYLVLLLPLAGLGLAALLGALAGRSRPLAYLAAGALVLALGIATVEGGIAFFDATASTNGQQIALADEIDALLPPGALVAVHDAGAIRYVGGRDIYDMIGLTTQGAAAAWRQGSGAILETMAGAARRPTHFATYPNVSTIPYLADTSLFGRLLFETDPYGRRTASTAGPVQALYEADWRLAEGKNKPRQPDIVASTSTLSLLTAVNLADLQDESARGLTWSAGRPQPGFTTEAYELPFSAAPELSLLDGGRMVSGAVTLPLPAAGDAEIWLAARVHAREAGTLAVSVDGRAAGEWRFPAAPGEWLESLFPLPEGVEQEGSSLTLALSDPQGVALPLGLYHLWVYTGQPQWVEHTPQIALQAEFGPGIVLEGVDLPPLSAAAGDKLALTLYWRAAAPPDLDAKAFLHLYNEAGELVAQIDQRPYFDTRPPYTWQPGRQIADPYRLLLPGDLAAGTYQLAVGLYDPDSGARMPIKQLDRGAVADSLTLATIQIAAPGTEP